MAYGNSSLIPRSAIPQASPDHIAAILQRLQDAGFENVPSLDQVAPAAAIDQMRSSLQAQVKPSGMMQAWKNDAKQGVAEQMGVGDFMKKGGLKSL